jgi:hypothetical protein
VLSLVRRTGHKSPRVLLDLNSEFTSRGHDEDADLAATGLLRGAEETLDGRDEEGEGLSGSRLGLSETIDGERSAAEERGEKKEENAHVGTGQRSRDRLSLNVSGVDVSSLGNTDHRRRRELQVGKLELRESTFTVVAGGIDGSHGASRGGTVGVDAHGSVRTASLLLLLSEMRGKRVGGGSGSAGSLRATGTTASTTASAVLVTRRRSRHC